MKSVRIIAAAAVILPLAACDTFLGANEGPPLPGERLAILVQEQTLTPDESAEDQEIVLPAPTENTSWPQAGGYPNHAMHHIEIASELRHAWTVDVGTGSRSDRVVAQPVVAGGRIYTLDARNVLRAGEAATGREIWRVDLTPKSERGERHVSGGLGVEGGTVYVTTGFGDVVAIAAEDGTERWRRNLAAPLRAAPTIHSGRVFAVSVTNRLHALDVADGTLLWTHSGIEETASLLGGGSPAVESEVVVVPYSSGELVALRVENGQELWSDSLAGQRRTRGTTSLSAIRGRPIIDRGVVYAVGFGGLTAAINLRTGRRIWDREIAGIESPWIAGDTLFLLSANSELAALNRADGRIRWVAQLPEFEDPEDKEGRIVWAGPILVSDRLIVAGSTGEAWSVSPYTGEILGKVSLPDGVTISPIVAGDTIYFLSEDAELVAYR